MNYGVRAAKYIAISSMLAAGGIGACSSNSGNGGQSGDDSDAGHTVVGQDSGAGEDAGNQVTPTTDSGSDTSVSTSQDAGTDSNPAPSEDAGIDATDSAVTPFCLTQTGLNFCQDFDEGNPLSISADGGGIGACAVSTAQASSAPNSLLVALPEGPTNTDQSAKVVKMITPTSGVTQAIYEFDMYISSWPAAATGGFATDFQFLDTNGGSDQFGFRIGVFTGADGGFDHADLEHNHPTLGGSDDITSPIAITPSAWNHVKMVVAYSALANDGGDSVAFQLYLNKSATAAIDANYPAPFASAAFARFAAGMVYAFDGTNKDWNIYYDNFTLKLQ